MKHSEEEPITSEAVARHNETQRKAERLREELNAQPDWGSPMPCAQQRFRQKESVDTQE